MADRFIDSLGEHPTLFTARDEGIVFAPGEVVAGRFEVVDTLGGGGMGLVYRVRDTLMGGRVKALKVILPSLMSSEKARERFVQEAEIAQGLAHPNIVNTFDLGEHRGVRFITMELLQGQSLHERLQAKQKLPLHETAGIIRQVCAALDYAHRTTIHRDIKPQNIFLCADGTVKLLDFGLARAAGSNRFTQSSMAVGTAVYLAPEQLQGQEATNRSDLYSLGVVLYQCLTGALPLGRFALPTELDASLPEVLDALVDSLLKPQPERRPDSATEVAARLESINEAQRRQEEAAALAREREARERAAEARRYEQAERERRETEAARKREEAARRAAQQQTAPSGVGAGVWIVGLIILLVIAGVAVLVLQEGSSRTTTSSMTRPSASEQGVTPTTATATSPVSGPGPGSRAGETRTVDLGGGVKLELVWIPPGEFMMGSPSSEEDRSDNETQHRVELTRGFWMGKYEVTQAQWASVMGSNPSGFKGADRPVEQVSWDDCQSFLERLNSRVSGGGFRLPTEAEWEYACRAGTTTRFFFGNSDGDLHRYGNYCERSNTDNFAWQDKDHNDGHDKTAPVGSFLPNGWGLHDMHGNVWEWCQDWYGDYPSGAVRDPQGPSSGSGRVPRGGSWCSSPRYCRSAYRFFYTPGSGDGGLGFRLVLSPVR